MISLRHFTLRQRFVAMGLLALAMAALPTGLWVVRATDAVSQMRTEQTGLAPAGGVIQMARLTARHRGLTNGALSGDAAAEAKRADAWAALQAAWPAVQDAMATLDDADLRQRLADLWQAQQALTTAIQGRQLAAPAAFARHTALIDQHLLLLADVAVRSGLVLHPYASGYHLQDAALRHLPLVAELGGRVRGAGMGILARGQASPADRARIAALADRIEAVAADGARAVALATEANPALRARLGEVPAQARTALAEALALARDAIVATEAPTHAPADWWARTTAAVDAQLALGDAALQALSADLEAAAGAEQRTLAFGIVLLLALGGSAAALGWRIATGTARSIDDAIALADAVADGDLTRTAHAHAEGRDEGARLSRALARMAAQLRQVVGGVRDNAGQVATASAQIAQGNQDLSSRTESQASALQQTAASMEELRTTIAASADAARQAAVLAREARGVAERGGQSVGELVGAMAQISDSARRMQDIVATIDGIAFQTNILALNAAVEAARAGEQGRGFAVVAGEVRALAQRSGVAAREIRGLITASEERVAEGSGKGTHVRETMADVVAAIGKVSELISEVSGAAQEQSRGVAQVGEAVTEMDRVTQQNAALVEESAAAAESLRQQAQALQGAMESFRT
ncbi:MAG: methyl-accepting chemotaxis protein [Burkholderiaceae bacterium]|nr:methyl-accepting chemotaxis protein [Burkholderiaceae bacterium]